MLANQGTTVLGNNINSPLQAAVDCGALNNSEIRLTGPNFDEI
jgi:hypothetical protein